MPSESQYNQALRELADLQKELESLEAACDSRDAANRIMDFIANTQEGLTDPNNTIKQGGGDCSCQIL